MKLTRTLLCLQDYEEDNTKYWSKGYTYPAKKHQDNSWSIETNLENIGAAGHGYSIDEEEFDNYFVEVKCKPYLHLFS